MINLLFENPILFAVTAVGLVLAIGIHEFAHAYVADRLGDPTPRLQGRVTLNPIKHLDLFGSLFILFVGFGWGKPVQFDPFNLRDPRRDGAIIALAGPVSNVILAAVTGLVTLGFQMAGMLPSIASAIAYLFIYTNLGLAVFNMIPIHPLDGFKIVGGILPPEKAHEWYALERYGMIFLILLIVPLGNSTMVSTIVRPIVQFLAGIFAGHLM
ncbi:MAG: site-2 protease family protein [Patescibacteria group bacterium]|nr:site-2 protease family protein [Patescibacteria group bacterium]